jgi:predicted SAM-dependent methyltransferase
MRYEPEDFSDLFLNGMKRNLPRLMPVPPGGLSLNIGSGNAPIRGCLNLDPSNDRVLRKATVEPGDYHWMAPMFTTFASETISSIHAYHFLEHLFANDVHNMLLEVQRVLKPGGVFYYCVPYAMAPIAFMDIDHKTFWTEETMRTMLESRGYHSAITDKMEIKFQVIAGVTSQNLAVMGALQKKNGESNGS